LDKPDFAGYLAFDSHGPGSLALAGGKNARPKKRLVNNNSEDDANNISLF
jgi:hypothetical protein